MYSCYYSEQNILKNIIHIDIYVLRTKCYFTGFMSASLWEFIFSASVICVTHLAVWLITVTSAYMYSCLCSKQIIMENISIMHMKCFLKCCMYAALWHIYSAIVSYITLAAVWLIEMTSAVVISCYACGLKLSKHKNNIDIVYMQSYLTDSLFAFLWHILSTSVVFGNHVCAWLVNVSFVNTISCFTNGPGLKVMEIVITVYICILNIIKNLPILKLKWYFLDIQYAYLRRVFSASYITFNVLLFSKWLIRYNELLFKLNFLKIMALCFVVKTCVVKTCVVETFEYG